MSLGYGDMRQNLIPGQGRKKGSVNKKTIARQAAFEKYLLENNSLFKLLESLFSRLENDPKSVRTADIINALKWVAQYEVKTLAEQEASERLDQILDNDNPEQMKADILDFVGKLKAVQ
ncbi:hypothetical protein UM48_004719 [Salmonella enterica subsp. enterica]|nr:hypothetical protein [Salmonella enterica subsp. enterica]